MHGVWVTAVFLTACGPEGHVPDRAMTVRDSAGVTIVENHDSAWTAQTRWRIADEPELAIGSVDGSAPGTDFGWISQVAALPSGVAVLEGNLDEIRVFDEAGRWMSTVGRKGDGPTEFQYLADIWPAAGDSVAGFGDRHRKVVTFPLGGGEARVHSTPQRLHNGFYGWEIAGWRSDGAYVLEAADDPRQGIQGLGVDSSRFVLFSAEGDSLSTWGPFPRNRRVLDGEVYGVVLLSQLATVQVRDRGLWHAFPDRGFEVTYVDFATGSRRIVRRSYDPVPSPPGLIDEVAAQEIDGLRGTPVEDAARARWAVSIQLDTLPAFKRFKAAPDGTVWVQGIAHPDSVRPEERASGRWPAASNWTVFDPDGRWLGTVRMPDGLTVHEVGVDWVLGVREDELGIPWVEQYRILRP